MLVGIFNFFMYLSLKLPSFIASFFLVIFTNIGMVTGIVPVVGVPLPLCSYGGSALISNFVGFGIILNGYNYRDFKLHNI